MIYVTSKINYKIFSIVKISHLANSRELRDGEPHRDAADERSLTLKHNQAVCR